ncbi:MAG: hypothetical protein JWM43_1843 [Acidobacteriaceae bacterium]|nr:hypothetical protein [Acidobacteriaceae bacterium]
MAAGSVFLEKSKGVVRDFLRTVVLVDDRAYLEEKPQSPQPSSLINPGKQGGDSAPERVQTPLPSVQSESTTKVVDVSPVAATSNDSPSVPPAAAPNDHSLNGKAVIDEFAKVGIICAVVRPTEEELQTLSGTLQRVGPTADVVILDWVLYENKFGEKTLELIETLAASSKAESGRARLIVVYTAEPNLADIAGAIRKTLKRPELSPTDDPFTVAHGGLRVCVYGKEGLRTTQIGLDRALPPKQLPDMIISEFAELTKGLLSNVAIKSISAIRSNTYQLLARFSPAIDPAFVTHSTLICPEEAAEQVAALIVSEIQEILEDEEVGEATNFLHIVEWLDDRIQDGLTFNTTATLNIAAYRSGLVHLLENGTGTVSVGELFTDHTEFSREVLKSKEKASGLVRKSLTEILSMPATVSLESDASLAMLMSLRQRYKNPPPALTLGTIVMRSQGDVLRYLLCLQPVCDSVRLKGPRTYPFIQLGTTDDPNSCHFIVRDKTELRFLTIKYNPYLLEMAQFAPNAKAQVIGELKGNDVYFSASDTDATFRWVADLKPAHAQRVANNFGSTVSRVGLVESEWNRLGAPKG